MEIVIRGYDLGLVVTKLKLRYGLTYMRIGYINNFELNDSLDHAMIRDIGGASSQKLEAEVETEVDLVRLTEAVK